MSDFTEAVEGSTSARPWPGLAAGEARTPAVSRVSGSCHEAAQVARLTGHERAFLKQNSPGAIKVTLPSATQFPAIAYKRGHQRRRVSDHAALLWDIVAIIRGEVQALVAEGVPYIQIDAPRYSYYMDPKWRDYIRDEMRRPGSRPRRGGPCGQRLPEGGGAARASRSRSTSAAATTAATGTPRAATTDRGETLRHPPVDRSCSSTTTSAPAPSSRCASSRGARPWSSGWSAASGRAGVPADDLSGGSKRRRARPARGPGPLPPVRFRLDDGGQPPLRR